VTLPKLLKRPLFFVGGLLILSVLMGVLALRNYLNTDRYLHGVLRDMAKRGKGLTAEQCVDAVLRWRKECRGSRVLCDNFSGRVMRTCLEARDRRAFCERLPADSTTTHFGYQDCKDRGVTRQTKRACASAFRMIDVHCRRLRRAKLATRRTRPAGAEDRNQDRDRRRIDTR
jgi:hypothetical protein